MKLTCPKDKLRDLVGLAERATSKNPALPILATILLEAKGKHFSLRATNLEVGIEIDIPVKVEKEGTVAVNATTLSGFLSNLGAVDKVVITTEENNLRLVTDRSSTLIKCLPVDDFPLIPRVESRESVALPSQSLIFGLKAVLVAAATSDIKPEIASVYIYTENKELIFVATDSFRLAEKRIALTATGQIDFSPVIIPLKNIAEIIRALETITGEVAINLSKNQVSFFAEHLHLTSTIIEGIFPDYQQIMPKKHQTEVLVEKNDFAESLRLANVFSDRFNKINLRLLGREEKLELTSRNQDVGENTAVVKAKTAGADLEMSFNVKYILDCFPAIDSPRLVLQFTEPSRPLLIFGENDPSFRYIVMPINR